MSLWSFWSKKEKDPVCRMYVDRKTAAATFDHRDKTYYFCSPRCKAAFAKKPKRYLKMRQTAMAGTGGSCH